MVHVCLSDCFNRDPVLESPSCMNVPFFFVWCRFVFYDTENFYAEYVARLGHMNTFAGNGFLFTQHSSTGFTCVVQ